MGRKPKALVPKEAVAMEAMKISREDADRIYGDGLPFDPVRVETKITANNTTALDSMIDAGRGYLWLKAYLNHGEFMDAVQRTSDSHTYVINCMRFADTFPNSPPVANLGVRRARSIAMMDKPVVEKYLNGGPLGDIPHDDVAKMPVRDLEEEVRKLRKKAKEDRKAFEDALSAKSGMIDKLENEIRYREPPTKEQLAQAKLDEIGKEFLKLLVEASDSMEQCKIRVLEAQRVEGVTPILLDNWQLRYNDYIEDLNKTREELGILIDELHPEAEGGLI